MRGVEACPADTVRVIGGLGSPYSNKVAAATRYLRAPHRWLIENSPEARDLPKPPGPRLLPSVVWGDGAPEGDSTPLLRELSRRYPRRALYPPHAGLALLSDVIEDFADEWLSKAMYHYRWTYDAEAASRGIALKALGVTAPEKGLKMVQATIRKRQTSRMGVVGSTPLTGPVIEASFERFLALFDAHLASGSMFLLGARPCAADFAIFGQLHPMIAMDQNTAAKVLRCSTRVVGWYHVVKDLSGYSVPEGDAGWVDPAQPLPPTLTALLSEAGRLYAPFLVANAAAVARGEKEVTAALDAGAVRWVQPTAATKYQVKCLRWLREAHAALPAAERGWADAQLRGTGVDALFAAAPARL